MLLNSLLTLLALNVTPGHRLLYTIKHELLCCVVVAAIFLLHSVLLVEIININAGSGSFFFYSQTNSKHLCHLT